ncbi:MAG: hypothetical protein AAFV71_26260 [Cyanobacteria bacterium J06633_8]
MATLQDLSKEQLVELFFLASEVNEKHLQVLQYITTQISQKPQHPRGYIDLPIKEMSDKEKEFRIQLDRVNFENAFNSDNPEILYSHMKQSLKDDLKTYTI